MIPLVVIPVTLPSDIDTRLNGRLPAELLVDVGHGTVLHHLAARAWAALLAQATAQAIALTWTPGGCYRTFAQQQALFASRYQAAPKLPGRPTKVYNGVTYWQRPNTAMAAVPGTSNHGFGLAIDTALGSDPAHATTIAPALDWLAEHAPRFGFSWETIPSEPWHIRYVAGDRLPATVLAAPVIAGAGATATATAERIPTPTEDDMSTRILRSLKDPPDFAAEFIAQVDANGVAIEVQWSGDGTDPRVRQRMADLRAAGVADMHVELAGLRNCALHPKNTARQIAAADGLYRWADTDFAP